MSSNTEIKPNRLLKSKLATTSTNVVKGKRATSAKTQQGPVKALLLPTLQNSSGKGSDSLKTSMSKEDQELKAAKAKEEQEMKAAKAKKEQELKELEEEYLISELIKMKARKNYERVKKESELQVFAMWQAMEEQRAKNKQMKDDF